ncbi:hypothetical protein Ahy_B09g098142 [Arachis hypogaea]|uniref:mRNA-decapping enzyme-like protein n=2 Tax=Arachis TaxID=3817 RepID=A0A444XQL6_ARAHY|nr:hypothetical protein Ahy_B09g098142 [Arachis hypogaea]
MSQNGKLMPNLDQHSTKLLNLTVLQCIDPFVKEILITAAHVTFYEFNIDLSQWSCKDVEGSLFVVKRNTQPRFQFIVMNRRNIENLVDNLLGDFEYEVQVPYLLYRNAAQEVNGIWFYNARECEEVANLFNRILNAYAKVPPKSKILPIYAKLCQCLYAVEPPMSIITERKSFVLPIHEYIMEVVKECPKALDMNPVYIKALVRRGKAHEKLEHFEETIPEVHVLHTGAIQVLPHVVFVISLFSLILFSSHPLFSY